MYFCRHCEKSSKSSRGIKKHETYCHSNPDRKTHHNQFSKAKSLGLPIPVSKCKGRPGKSFTHTEESKDKMKAARKIAFEEGRACGKNRIKFYKENPDKYTYLYFVKFISDENEFVKIGISECGPISRFSSKEYEKYTKDIIFSHYIDAYTAAVLERNVLRKYKKQFGYKLEENFNGKSELFHTSTIEMIEKYVTECLGRAGASKDSNPDTVEFYSLAARQTPRKKYTWNKNYTDKIQDKNKKIRPLLEEINFTEWGWVSKAAKIIGISPQKTKAYIKRHMPELLE